MKKRGLKVGIFLAVSLVFFLSLSLASAQSACPPAQTIMKLNSNLNTHGELWNGPNYNSDISKICYVNPTRFTTAPTYPSNVNPHDCNGRNLILYLTAGTNAHAFSKESYDPVTSASLGLIPVCYGNLSCTTKSSCNSVLGEKIIVELSNDSNAHIGIGSSYSRLVCCKALSPFTPERICSDNIVQRDLGEECEFNTQCGQFEKCENCRCVDDPNPTDVRITKAAWMDNSGVISQVTDSQPLFIYGETWNVGYGSFVNVFLYERNNSGSDRRIKELNPIQVQDENRGYGIVRKNLVNITLLLMEKPTQPYSNMQQLLAQLNISHGDKIIFELVYNSASRKSNPLRILFPNSPETTGCASFTNLLACSNWTEWEDDGDNDVVEDDERYDDAWNSGHGGLRKCGDSFIENGQNCRVECRCDKEGNTCSGFTRRVVCGGDDDDDNNLRNCIPARCTTTSATPLSDECIDGQMEYQITQAFEAARRRDPSKPIDCTTAEIGSSASCTNELRMLPCGLSFATLPFFAYWQIMIALILIAIIYLLINRLETTNIKK